MSEQVQIFRRRAPLVPPQPANGAGVEAGALPVAFPEPERVGTAVQAPLDVVVHQASFDPIAAMQGVNGPPFDEPVDAPEPGPRKGPRPPLAPEKVLAARALRAEGKTVKEVAKAIGISPITAAKYVSDVVVPDHLKPKRGRQPGVKPAAQAAETAGAAVTQSPHAYADGLAKARAVKAANRAAAVAAAAAGGAGGTVTPVPQAATVTQRSTAAGALPQAPMASSDAAAIVVTLVKSGKLSINDALEFVPARELLEAALDPRRRP